MSQLPGHDDVGDPALDLLHPAASATRVARRPLGAVLRRSGSTFVIAASIAGLLIAFLAIDLWRSRLTVEAQAFRETASLAGVFESTVAADVHGIDQMLVAFGERAKRLDAQNQLSGHTVDLLEDDGKLLLQSLPASSLTLLSKDGRVIVSTVLPRGLTLKDQDYVAAALRNGTRDGAVFGTATPDPISGDLIVPMSRAIYRADGSLIGVTVATLAPAGFVKPFQSPRVERYRTFMIVQTNGLIIARTPETGGLIGSSLANSPLFKTFLPAAATGSVSYTGTVHGRRVILSYAVVPGTNFVITSALGADEVYAPWWSLARIYLFLGLCLCLAIGICTWLVSREQSRRQMVVTARRVRAILDGITGFVAMLNADGTIVEINRGPLDSGKLDRGHIIGRPMWDVAWFSYAQSVQATVRDLIRRAGGGTIRQDLRVRLGPEQYGIVDLTFQSIEDAEGSSHIIATAIDVTAQRETEEQLRQSQKMEALGLLAGGIAHDFNNLLAVISNFAQFLVDDLAAGSAERGFAERIGTACLRGKEIVSQILTYAQPRSVTRATVELVPVLTEITDLLQISKPATITFERRFTPSSDPSGSPCVVANRAQLTQIILNLCVNAVDALGAAAGVVAISLDLATPGDLLGPLHPWGMDNPVCHYRSGGAAAGERYVRIGVSDTGPGIEPGILQRIFDPFYTTKRQSRGTGLGLAVVHSIVSAQGGIIEVESMTGRGTVFAIYLPLGA